MFAMMETARLESLHFAVDPLAGLQAISPSTIVAWDLHWEAVATYPMPTPGAHIDDVLRLAKGMSYKAAFVGLQHSGDYPSCARRESWRAV